MGTTVRRTFAARRGARCRPGPPVPPARGGGDGVLPARGRVRVMESARAHIYIRRVRRQRETAMTTTVEKKYLHFKFGGPEKLSILVANALAVNVLAVHSACQGASPTF